MLRFKTMGLVAVAAMALTAMVGVASASAAQFHSNAASAALIGTQEGSHKFTAGGVSVTCTTATFSGTGSASGTSETQEMHPEYSGCTFAGLPGAVSTAGCLYKFNASNENVELKNCTNGGVTVHASAFFGTTTCHMFIKNQTGINKNVIVAGKSTDKKLVVRTDSNNIFYKVLESKGICPLTKGEEAANAVYEGDTGVVANSGMATIWKE